MPKLLLVERDGAVLPLASRPRPRTRWGRPNDVLVRMRLTDWQFWRFLLEFCEPLGMPSPQRSRRNAS